MFLAFRLLPNHYSPRFRAALRPRPPLLPHVLYGFLSFRSRASKGIIIDGDSQLTQILFTPISRFFTT